MNIFVKCNCKDCERYKICKRNDGRNKGMDYSKFYCNVENNYKYFVEIKSKTVTKVTENDKEHVKKDSDNNDE